MCYKSHPERILQFAKRLSRMFCSLQRSMNTRSTTPSATTPFPLAFSTGMIPFQNQKTFAILTITFKFIQVRKHIWLNRMRPGLFVTADSWQWMFRKAVEPGQEAYPVELG